MNPSQRKFGGVKTALLLVVLALLGVGGFAAFKIFFNRPGETAIGLIPADASVVVTLDTNPSPNQVHAYQTISEALKREGVDSKVSDGISAILGKAGIAQEMRQYVKTSFAFAMWAPEKGLEGKPQGIGLISISDPSAVSAILAKTGKPGPNGTYTIEMVTVAVVGDYLAIASGPDVVARVQAVKSGSQPSMASLQDYQIARQDLPQDANLMVFVSPKAIESFSHMTGSKAGFNTTTWMAFGTTLRDDGLQFDMRAPINVAAVPGLARMSAMHPLDATSFNHLPAGAYGVIAYAQPAEMWNVAQDSLSSDPAKRDQLNKAVKDFEDHTGLSVPNDLLPALKGNMLVAAYPDANGEPKSMDFVLVADNSNGATPIALAEKIPGAIEKGTKDAKDAPHFVKSEENGVTIYSLDAASQEKMEQGMSPHHDMPAMPAQHDAPEGTPTPTTSPSAEPTPDGGLSQHDGPATAPPINTDPKREVPPMLKNKTLTWAEVNGCVVIASSKAMLDKAIAAFHGGPNLSSDTAFQTSIAKANGDQTAMIISMRRLMTGLRPMLEQSMGHGGPSFDDLLNLFGAGDAAMFVGGKVQNNVGTGTWFMPLDFNRLAALIHKGTSPSPQPMEGGADMTIPPR